MNSTKKVQKETNFSFKFNLSIQKLPGELILEAKFEFFEDKIGTGLSFPESDVEFDVFVTAPVEAKKICISKFVFFF